MTDREAMLLALDALEKDPAPLNAINNAKCFLYSALEQPDHFSRLVRIMGTFDLSTGHADNWNDLLDSLESELRDVLGYYREAFKVEQECSTHPDAPHGFNRDASHNYGRYVCDCEGWKPPDDDAAWARHLKEPVSEKRVHESDTMERHVSYVCPQCHWTLEQPGQEPVACKHNRYSVDVHEQTGTCYDCGAEGRMRFVVDDTAPPKQPEHEPYCYHDGRNIVGKEYADHSDVFPLYTAPPKRNWVGLTDDEIWELYTDRGSVFARSIEAKLKEKNA